MKNSINLQKSIGLLAIATSILLGVFDAKPDYFFPFFSWKLFSITNDTKAHYFIFTKDDQKLDFKNRYRKNLTRSYRKKIWRDAQYLGSAIENGYTSKKIIQRIKLTMLEAQETCAFSLYKVIYDPTKLYRKNKFHSIKKLYEAKAHDCQ